MDHPAEFVSPQPWRAAAIVASGVAALELFALILLGLVFGAKLFSDKAADATKAAVHQERPAATAGKESSGSSAHAGPVKLLPRAQTSVIVLNGNGIPGAAAVSADHAHELRYIVTATGNAPRTDFQHSLVMFRPGYKAAATRLAKDMSVKRVTPLDGMQKGDLQGAQLALIIGG
jgi:LytR cell envelope-related transcriptional attenuator